MSAIIISADELKKTITGYDPKTSHLVHRESARMADKMFDEALKNSKFKEVILLSGGAASGKTEFMSEYLVNRDVIILDGTLPSIEGIKNKFRKATKYGKEVKIVAVWPEDFKIAFAAFLHRDRKFPDEHFYLTHSKSRKALLDAARQFPAINIDLIESVYDKGRLRFFQYVFDSREHLIEEINDNQYTKSKIIERIRQDD